MKPAQSAPAEKSRPHKSQDRENCDDVKLSLGSKNFRPTERACVEATAVEFLAPHRRWASKPFPASPALPAARCIDTEFPSETAFFCRAAPDAVPEISICRNRQRTFQRRAAGCHRRGNALRPSAPERRNIGPWLISSFANRIVWSNGIKVLPATRRPSISSMFKRFFDARKVFHISKIDVQTLPLGASKNRVRAAGPS
jgi:hypothetical protein